MATTVELFGQLEKKVSEAESKLKVLNDSEAAQAKAQKEYDLALAEVEDLKTQLMGKIGGLLPNPRVRVAK